MLLGGSIRHVEIAGRRTVEDAQPGQVAVSTTHVARSAVVSTLGTLIGTLLASPLQQVK